MLATASGAEAVETLRSQAGSDVHLLLTDVVLPGMTGRELAETLQARHAVSRVLYTSGYTEDIIIRHGVCERGIDFLPKPYTSEQLAHKVRQVLDAPPKASEGTAPA